MTKRQTERDDAIRGAFFAGRAAATVDAEREARIKAFAAMRRMVRLHRWYGAQAAKWRAKGDLERAEHFRGCASACITMINAYRGIEFVGPDAR